MEALESDRLPSLIDPWIVIFVDRDRDLHQTDDIAIRWDDRDLHRIDNIAIRRDDCDLHRIDNIVIRRDDRDLHRTDGIAIRQDGQISIGRMTKEQLDRAIGTAQLT